MPRGRGRRVNVRAMARRRRQMRRNNRRGLSSRALTTVNRSLQPFPNRYICKMKYATNVTTSAVTGQYIFNLNIFNNFYNSTSQYSNEGDKSILVRDRIPRILNISSYDNSKPTLFTIDTNTEIQKNVNYSNQNVGNYNDDRAKNFKIL